MGVEIEFELDFEFALSFWLSLRSILNLSLVAI